MSTQPRLLDHHGVHTASGLAAAAKSTASDGRFNPANRAPAPTPRPAHTHDWQLWTTNGIPSAYQCADPACRATHGLEWLRGGGTGDGQEAQP